MEEEHSSQSEENPALSIEGESIVYKTPISGTSDKSESEFVDVDTSVKRKSDKKATRDDSDSFVCKTPFVLETDVIDAHKKTLPSVEEEIVKAKQYLKKQAPSGDTLYDHLAELIQRVLLYQPENIVDFVELFSRDLKEERFQSNFDRLRNEYILSKNMDETLKLTNLYKEMKIKYEEEITDLETPLEPKMEDDENTTFTLPNMVESNFYFRQAGFGLPDWEMFNLTISMNTFVRNKPVIPTKVRFFGIIFGTVKNYYILETELTAEEIEKRFQKESEEKFSVQGESKHESETIADNADEIKLTDRNEEQSEEGMSEKTLQGPEEEPLPDLPTIPTSKWQPPKEIKPEKLGEGLNKKVYWVCNNIGENWICLPEVEPKHIDIARKITNAMSGNLEREMQTYPPFEGNEKHYLRAQIARIVASTSVSPVEYYIRGSEQEDEEEELEAEDDTIMEIKKNKHYEGHPIHDLLNKSLAFWVHHYPYMLKQGRVTWWNPYGKEEEGEGDEEEEQEGEEDASVVPDGVLQETPLPLLVPLSDEAMWEGGTGIGWEVAPAHKIQPPAAAVRSLRWPGAVAYATADGRADFMYVGWGLKYLPEAYSPPLLPMVCSEYPLGPEIMEMLDPTVEEEEAFRIANLPPLPPLEISGEGEEMEGEFDE